MDKKLKLSEVIIILMIIALVVVALYSCLRIAESVLRGGPGPDPTAPSKTIIRDGVEYYPRQDMIVIMVAGIDEFGVVQDSGTYNNPGEADMVALVILNQSTKKIDVLALNRDTMLDMPVLGIGGKQAGTKYGQLALAHTYGNGLTESSENLKNTVSDFLYGLDIDYYVTMNMDAISRLNDAVGGVTVTVEDDFSSVDPTIGMGKVKLQGQQAVSFLRSRQLVGDQLNLTRMKRHEVYISSFVTELRAKLSADKTFATVTYADVAEYMVTDVSSSALLGLVEHYSDYEMGQIYSLKGENKVGEYMEYHVDEAELDRMILQLFYAPKVK